MSYIFTYLINQIISIISNYKVSIYPATPSQSNCFTTGCLILIVHFISSFRRLPCQSQILILQCTAQTVRSRCKIRLLVFNSISIRKSGFPSICINSGYSIFILTVVQRCSILRIFCFSSQWTVTINTEVLYSRLIISCTSRNNTIYPKGYCRFQVREWSAWHSFKRNHLIINRCCLSKCSRSSLLWTFQTYLCSYYKVTIKFCIDPAVSNPSCSIQTKHITSSHTWTGISSNRFFSISKQNKVSHINRTSYRYSYRLIECNTKHFTCFNRSSSLRS